MSAQEHLDPLERSYIGVTGANGLVGCPSSIPSPAIANHDALSTRETWVIGKLKKLSKEAYELKVLDPDSFEPYNGDAATMMIAGRRFRDIHTALTNFYDEFSCATNADTFWCLTSGHRWSVRCQLTERIFPHHKSETAKRQTRFPKLSHSDIWTLQIETDYKNKRSHHKGKQGALDEPMDKVARKIKKSSKWSVLQRPWRFEGS